MRSNKIDYLKNPKICLKCGNTIGWDKRNNKFCSRSCSASYNNIGIQRHGSPMGVCVGCGNDTRNPSYCSNKCQKEHEWNVRKIEIEESGFFPPSNLIIRKYLMEKFGNICTICKNEEWMGEKIPLEVDHINGNSEDNSIENLRMVCGNCAMQLPTYKNKNKGNGRWSRRQRYSAGKSY